MRTRDTNIFAVCDSRPPFYLYLLNDTLVDNGLNAFDSKNGRREKMIMIIFQWLWLKWSVFFSFSWSWWNSWCLKKHLQCRPNAKRHYFLSIFDFCEFTKNLFGYENCRKLPSELFFLVWKWENSRFLTTQLFTEVSILFHKQVDLHS